MAGFANQPSPQFQGGMGASNSFRGTMPFGPSIWGGLNLGSRAQPNPVTQLQAKPSPGATAAGVQQAMQKAGIFKFAGMPSPAMGAAAPVPPAPPAVGGDPAMMGGMPPPGGDPAMMGAPPPPGGDPAMMGAPPPQGGDMPPGGPGQPPAAPPGLADPMTGQPLTPPLGSPPPAPLPSNPRVNPPSPKTSQQAMQEAMSLRLLEQKQQPEPGAMNDASGMSDMSSDLMASDAKIASFLGQFAKAAAQDNKQEQRSATGESKGLTYQHKADHYMQGKDAWDSVSGYFKGGKAAKPDPFMGKHAEELEKTANFKAMLMKLFNPGKLDQGRRLLNNANYKLMFSKFTGVGVPHAQQRVEKLLRTGLTPPGAEAPTNIYSGVLPKFSSADPARIQNSLGLLQSGAESLTKGAGFIHRDLDTLSTLGLSRSADGKMKDLNTGSRVAKVKKPLAKKAAELPEEVPQSGSPGKLGAGIGGGLGLGGGLATLPSLRKTMERVSGLKDRASQNAVGIENRFNNSHIAHLADEGGRAPWLFHSNVDTDLRAKEYYGNLSKAEKGVAVNQWRAKGLQNLLGKLNLRKFSIPAMLTGAGALLGGGLGKLFGGSAAKQGPQPVAEPVTEPKAASDLADGFFAQCRFAGLDTDQIKEAIDRIDVEKFGSEAKQELLEAFEKQALPTNLLKLRGGLGLMKPKLNGQFKTVGNAAKRHAAMAYELPSVSEYQSSMNRVRGSNMGGVFDPQANVAMSFGNVASPASQAANRGTMRHEIMHGLVHNAPMAGGQSGINQLPFFARIAANAQKPNANFIQRTVGPMANEVSSNLAETRQWLPKLKDAAGYLTKDNRFYHNYNREAGTAATPWLHHGMAAMPTVAKTVGGVGAAGLGLYGGSKAIDKFREPGGLEYRLQTKFDNWRNKQGDDELEKEAAWNKSMVSNFMKGITGSGARTLGAQASKLPLKASQTYKAVAQPVQRAMSQQLGGASIGQHLGQSAMGGAIGGFSGDDGFDPARAAMGAAAFNPIFNRTGGGGQGRMAGLRDVASLPAHGFRNAAIGGFAGARVDDAAGQFGLDTGGMGQNMGSALGWGSGMLGRGGRLANAYGRGMGLDPALAGGARSLHQGGKALGKAMTEFDNAGFVQPLKDVGRFGKGVWNKAQNLPWNQGMAAAEPLSKSQAAGRMLGWAGVGGAGLGLGSQMLQNKADQYVGDTYQTMLPHVQQHAMDTANQFMQDKGLLDNNGQVSFNGPIMNSVNGLGNMLDPIFSQVNKHTGYGDPSQLQGWQKLLMAGGPMMAGYGAMNDNPAAMWGGTAATGAAFIPQLMQMFKQQQGGGQSGGIPGWPQQAPQQQFGL